jgi:regulation of enolase protein 1 (concanavalin A-like superfamily)
MTRRPSRLFASVIALCTTAAAAHAGEDETPRDLPGWGRVVDPSRDCDASLVDDRNRLRITVPGTPHVLSAEDHGLPMNAPRVVRRVRGDFTADVRVLGRLEPGRSRTTHYDPYHGAGLIVWQDPSNYLRLERAVGFIKGRPHPYLNYELREGGRLAVSHGITVEDRPLSLKLRRRGRSFSAWFSRDGRRWVELARVDAALYERVEVGVVAVNSSARTLSAELERFSVKDPQGSTAREYRGDDTENTGAPTSGIEGRLSGSSGAGAKTHRTRPG